MQENYAMQLFTVGVNHTTAPIAIREHIAFSPERLAHALRDLNAHGVHEAAPSCTAIQTSQSALYNGWHNTISCKPTRYNPTPIHCPAKIPLSMLSELPQD